MTLHTINQCENPECALRFPSTERDRALRRCPRCGGALRVMESYSAAGDEASPSERVLLPLEIILDNLRSAFNVGSILRSADAAGVRRAYLCGITPAGDHPSVARTALGAENTVAWQAAPNGPDVARALFAEGVSLWALEETADSVSIFDASLPAGRVALIAGSEVAGVDPELMRLSSCIVSLPMRGRKRSLNVAVAMGAALVILAERLRAAMLE